MTDNVIESNQKPAKNPMEAAANKLREAKAKELQSKIDAQLKRTLDAMKVAENEKSALKEMIAEGEAEKAETSEMLKGL